MADTDTVHDALLGFCSYWLTMCLFPLAYGHWLLGSKLLLVGVVLYVTIRLIIACTIAVCVVGVPLYTILLHIKGGIDEQTMRTQLLHTELMLTTLVKPRG